MALIEVENRMSYRPDTKSLMSALLKQDSEAWASLSGLMAVLALPPVRCADGVYRKRSVEVEIAPGVWQLVDSIAIEERRIRFWFGTNGSRTEYTFLRIDKEAPRWRQSPQEPGVFSE